MSFQNCGMVFHDSPCGVFHSGQVVNGAFNITQGEPKQIQDLIFKAVGEGRTRWTESHGTGKDRKSTTFFGRETYFETTPVSLVGGYPRQNGAVIIGTGVSTFNFSFTLPPMLPSSFEGYYGKIRYYMKVTAARANKFDKSRKIPFTVVSLNNLNVNPINCMPIKQILNKNFSLFFAKKGSLEMSISLPMAGYVPGQQMPIDCFVKNRSRVVISSVTFCLERIVTYRCTYPYSRSRVERHKIVEYIAPTIAKDSESQLQVVLSLPALPPSSFMEVLITMQYFVKVRAIVTGMHSNLKTHIPVTIGNVPVYTQNYPGPSAAYGSSAPDLPEPSAPPQYADMGLPTYEESQMSSKMMEADPEDEDSGVPYAPRYPIYQFTSEKSNNFNKQ